MSFRGHNHCWGIHNPDWLKTLSPSEKRSALIAHITAVVGHYGTDAVAWDVVNEAISDGSCQDDGANPWCLKASDWFPDVPDFVFVAFETARKVAPSGVKLFYNDYSIANAHCTKAKRVYALVQNLTSRGLIDGIGLQMHVPRGWELKNDNGAGLTKTFAQYDALGIDVHITEMDVKNPDPADDAAQAKTYTAAVEACIASESCTNFESWGFTDSHTWLGSDQRPLPFDGNFQPKEAARSISDALLGSAAS